MDLSQLEIKGIRDPWKEGIAKGWHVIDGTTVTDEMTLEADVVIVGTGAGGGVSAEILSQAGLKVVMVELGRLKSSDQFDMHEGDAYRDLYMDGAARATKDGVIGIFQGRAVGGTTVVNWTSSFRTPPQTLQYWSDRFGVAGLSEAEMAPWFEQMEKRLNISKWALPPNANNDMIKRGCEKLGWAWDIIPRNVSGCWNLGYCGMGCPTNAKQSMLVTTIPSAMEAGAILIHSCHAEMIMHQDGKASGVTCYALDAQRQKTHRITIQADTVVASGGSINTPAFLLRSELPDPHQRIGKRTMLHCTTFSVGDYAEPIAGYYGAPQSLYSDEFAWKSGVDGAVGFKIEMMPTHPGIMSGLLAGFGKQARAEMERTPHYAASIGILRDGFHEQSEGGTVGLDDNGDPTIDYPINNYILDGVRRSHLAQVEMLFAAGADRARAGHSDARFTRSWKEAKAQIDGLKYLPGFPVIGCAHVMGGCAMGNNEHEAVTDHDGKLLHMDNVYIMDGSVFPTSIGANPQLSIYGVSARNATLLAQRLRSAVGA